MTELAFDLLRAVGFATISYFIALNALYLLFTVVAWRDVVHHRRTRVYRIEDEFYASPLTPGISVLLPAYNEEAGIVESVRSLLGLRYPEFEIVVANDGSTDETLVRLKQAFDLVKVDKALRTDSAHAPVEAVYLSRSDPKLVVIDKENGGKADALNAALSAASFPYVCAVDADALLEEGSLLQVVRPILEDPRVVAVGGIVRIANGCTVDHGQVVDVRLPKSRLATLQTVEYFRAFLVGRVAWSRMRALLIISGAFGLFQRELVEEVGGWAADTVGEDVELVVRLHRYLRERGEEYRVRFVPDPVCWTEAPEDWRVFARQRRRWQRGMLETIARHRRIVGNPRYGSLGLFASPYFVFFELLGPLVEVAGYLLVPLAVWLGALSVNFLVAFLMASVMLGVLLSLCSLTLEEVGFRRHRRGGDILKLILYSVVENLGYRQATTLLRLLATVDWLRGKRGWGEMTRRGFKTESVELPFESFEPFEPFESLESPALSPRL